jgi:hypothetical protein
MGMKLTHSGENRLRVLEIRVLRRDEVTEGNAKLRNEECHNLCSSLSTTRMKKQKAREQEDKTVDR